MAHTYSRVTLAYQDMRDIPAEVNEKYSDWLDELDLSYNCITNDLRFLTNFTNLSTLILDHNSIQSHAKMPVMPTLHTLWLNHNKITNLGVFITRISKCCPRLKHLSMMNNVAAPSYFNGGTYQQYLDYRQYVISQIPSLQVLDDTAINMEERAEAERIYEKYLIYGTTGLVKPVKRETSTSLGRKEHYDKNKKGTAMH